MTIFSYIQVNNQSGEIANISVLTSETNSAILLALSSTSKMIFLGDYMPVKKVLLQDTKISADMQEQLNSLIYALEDIMNSSSNDIGYTILIKMDIETIPNLSPVASKPYTLPLKHQKWLEKSSKIWRKQELFKEVCLLLHHLL